MLGWMRSKWDPYILRSSVLCGGKNGMELNWLQENWSFDKYTSENQKMAERKQQLQVGEERKNKRGILKSGWKGI